LLQQQGTDSEMRRWPALRNSLTFNTCQLLVVVVVCQGLEMTSRMAGLDLLRFSAASLVMF
jgi:hypothetical protein